MAGTLLDIASGKRKKEDLFSAYDTGKRELLGKTMPAKGLTLVHVNYQ
jgi:tRNA U38,U39,U40 pseudouridine synthase TruA